MGWYKDGTVSVINLTNSVSGTGTLFAGNSRVGDGIRLPDGEWYEIVNIASDLTLGIYPAYQGPTISNSANYMIAPMQGYVKESADRLRQLITTVPVDAQDQLNNKQAKSDKLTSLANLMWAPNQLMLTTGETTATTINTGAKGRELVSLGTTADVYTSLGLGTAATWTVQTSPVDPTAGRLLMNGSWGWGDDAPVISSQSFKVARKNGSYYASSMTDGPATTSSGGSLLITGFGSESYLLFQPSGRNNELWRMSYQAGTWSSWVNIASLGLGQTYKDVTRSFGTWYNNNTGRPIAISIVAGDTSSQGVVMSVIIGGQVSIAARSNAAAYAGAQISLQNIVIPEGAAYHIEILNGTATIIAFTELS